MRERERVRIISYEYTGAHAHPHTFFSSGHLVCWMHIRRNGQRGNSTARKRLYP